MPLLLEKVKQTVLRYQLINDGDLVVVAVSGGADSLALLHLLYQLLQEGVLHFSLYVVHLNHGLRGRSAYRDAFFVRREAEKLGLPFKCGVVDTRLYKSKWGLSTEDAARRLRYRYLFQVAENKGASCIALGHHQDDQAETVLLNILRGTGPYGLAGMKIKREIAAQKRNTYLVRPLLETSKKEIEEYCRERELSPRFDESNLQLDYRRNRVRLELIPYLEKEFNPSFRKSLLQLSRLANVDQDYLEKCAESRFSSLLIHAENSRIELDARGLISLHEALQGRIVRFAIRRLQGGTGGIGYEHIKSVLELCLRNSSHAELDLPGSIKAYLSYGKLKLLHGAYPGDDVFAPQNLEIPGKVYIPEKGLLLKAELVDPGEAVWPPDPGREAFLDYERVLQAAERDTGEIDKPAQDKKLYLQVRPRFEGDRFHPLGAPGSKKIKDYFIDQKVPLEDRGNIPLVTAGDEVIWVVGMQISHGFRVTENTEKVLRLSMCQDEEKGL